MKKLLITIACVLLFLSYGNLVAQSVKDEGGGSTFQTEVSNSGTNAASFLEISVGARASALGGSYVAVANDPAALYYNPAGIVWNKGIQVELMHNEWLVETNFEFAGVTMSMPFWNSSIGASITMLDYGEQPVRTETRPEGTGEKYSAMDYAVGLTFASALTPSFSFGLTGKYVRQQIWHLSGGTGAIDLGIFYSTPMKGLRLGMSISNFGGEVKFDGRDLKTTVDPDPDNQNIDRVPVNLETNAYPLPQIFRAGISYSRDIGQVGSILLTTDVMHPSNSTESINLGFEYGYAGMFFLRAGYENLYEEDSINGLTLGGGIDYYQKGKMGIRIDYAFSDWGVLESAHRFSIGLSFE
jgi:hypothetical protein